MSNLNKRKLLSYQSTDSYPYIFSHFLFSFTKQTAICLNMNTAVKTTLFNCFSNVRGKLLEFLVNNDLFLQVV